MDSEGQVHNQTKPVEKDRSTAFLADGGEMGRLIRNHDWSSTPVGHPDTWPQSLRTTVRLMLNTNHPIFVFWGEQLTCFYNDAYRATLGPERHPQSLGASGKEVWAEIWDIIEPEIDQVMSGRGATWNEHKLIPITRHGKLDNIWWTYSYSPIDDESSPNGIGGVLVICTDVTAQHTATAALKDERERLMGLFEQAPGFIAVGYGEQHVFQIANKAYRQLVGGRELVGLSVRDALPELEGQGFYELLDQVYSSGQPFYGDNLPISLQIDPSKPPELRYVSFIYQPIRDADGKVMGIFVQGQDNTKSKLIELQLRETLEKNHAIIENSKDLICIFDSEGCFISVNSRSANILGYDPAELIGRNYAEFVFPEDIDDSGTVFSNVLDGKPVAEFENRYRHKDGHIVHVLWSAVWVQDQEKMFAIGKDITDWKKTEVLIRNAQKSEAVGQLTGGVAHDFNNLLTVILGNSEVLTAHLPEDSKLHMLADMIYKASLRGAELTQRLLAFARRQPLNPKAIDIAKMIRGLNGLLSRTLGENIEIEFICDGKISLAMVDESQLESAILNLCINSRDAMPNGGRLTISASNSYLDEEYVKEHADLRAGYYVVVAISDTGTGISSENLPKVFEPFFTTKEVGRGTGLGLSMVIGFIKQSKGHLTIYSELGHGTVVKLFLPKSSDEKAYDSISASNTPLDGGTEVILLVEDNDLVRAFATSQLGLLGYQVISTKDGPEAMKIVQSRDDIDLLFTDIIMPGGMNGREVAEQARIQKPTLKVLFTSGYSSDVFSNQSGSANNWELLTKPYTRLELARKIRQALDN